MTQLTFKPFGQVNDNAIGLGLEVTIPICEGLNIAVASFQALYLQYQKHHFVVDGAEFYSLHEYFQESYEAVAGHVHALAERLNGLGGTPAASFTKLAELSCVTPEPDGVFSAREMVEHDLQVEQTILDLLRRQASQAESIGDRATRYLYETILLPTEDRAFHLAHFLEEDSLTLGFVQSTKK